MRIGILKETNRGEARVILRPEEVENISAHGHRVLLEATAGDGVGFSDEAYEAAGATIKSTDEVYRQSNMLVKLRSPTDTEFKKIHDKILFSMLHTGQNSKRIGFIKKNGITAVEIESIKNDFLERYVDATDITGEVGVLYALRFIKKIPEETKVLILGYGRVGSAAIATCNRLNMNTKILRKSEYRHLDHFLKGKDVLINAICWPEEDQRRKNYLVTRKMLQHLNKGAVILDLSVDYPNPIETCKPTTLSKPWFELDGFPHISLYGYPGLVPLSSVNRYSKQALPLLLEIADNGGLRGIEKRSVLGRHIKNATIESDGEEGNCVGMTNSNAEMCV